MLRLPLPRNNRLPDPELREHLFHRNMANDDLPRIRMPILHLFVHHPRYALPVGIVQRPLSTRTSVWDDGIPDSDIPPRIVVPQLCVHGGCGL
jgi:hypothetical protein